MKKIGLLGLMLCAAGAASATSFEWTSGAITASTDTSINKTAGTDFSVAMSFDLASVPGDATTTLFQLAYRENATLKSGGPFISMAADGSILQRGVGEVAKWTSETNFADSLQTGTNLIVVTVDYQDSDGSVTGAPYDLVYSVYVNGALVGTENHTNVGGAVDDFHYAYTSVDGTTLYQGDGLATAEDVTALWESLNAEEPDPAMPEPTALALLALGVAGVALRRRVA